MPRAAGICQGAGGSKVVEPFAPFVLLALLHIGGGEFEIIRKPDLTRDDCAMASFHVEDQDRGAGAWCFSDPRRSAVEANGRSQPRASHLRHRRLVRQAAADAQAR